MRPTVNSSIQYAPDPVPTESASLPQYLRDEFQKLASVINLLALGHLDETFVAPLKPRTGDIRLADGTRWNPGLGRGVYIYGGASWVRWVAL